MKLINPYSYVAEQMGDRTLVAKQEIPQSFLDGLKSERMASTDLAAQDYHRVASVPVALYDIWIRQGHDPYRWTAKQLVKKLKEDGLDAFLTTNKRV